VYAIRKLKRLIFEPLVVISAEALTGLQVGAFGSKNFLYFLCHIYKARNGNVMQKAMFKSDTIGGRSGII